jgi:hypothetical protein
MKDQQNPNGKKSKKESCKKEIVQKSKLFLSHKRQREVGAYAFY